MTTLAFKDGVVAADRLTHEGHERFGFNRKVGRGRDAAGLPVVFGAIGETSICQRFLAWCSLGLPAGAEPPRMKEGGKEASGYVITNAGIFYAYEAELPPLCLEMHRHLDGTFYCAFGSGAEYALGAMHAGANALQAVEAAARFDVFTGTERDFLTFPEAE